MGRAGIALVAFAFLAGCASPPQLVAPKPTGWIKDEVSDSYVFGYPLVLMSIARDDAVGDGPGEAPLNTLRNAQALPPVGAANPPAPDVDTLDSTAWLDLAAEPLVLVLPNSRGRYVDARALDMWTNVVWSSIEPGTGRVSGIKAQAIAFVGPGWQGDLPAHVRRVDVPTRNAWITVRIATRGGRDLRAVHALQHRIHLVPLSVYDGDRDADNAAEADDRAPRQDDTPPLPLTAADTPAAEVSALGAQGFFDRLAQALQDNPPVPSDPHALKILADLGVKPGAPAQLPTDAAQAIAAGLADGRSRVATPPSNLLSANGWSWFGDDVGHYGLDYGLRAYAAYVAPGIGTKTDEVRATVSEDSDGHPLDGANRYVIHFASKQLPPVRAFWSLSAYTRDGALAEDAHGRFAVGDRDGLRRNRNGSVDVVVSAQRVRAANWLPAPHGAFQLVLRLYAPKPEASDGSWAPPEVVHR